MLVREGIALRELTTFRTGGLARYVFECTNEEEVAVALAYARERHVPYIVLGEGSNILAHDDGYDGLIILMRGTTRTYTDEGDGRVLVEADAGVPWEIVVQEAADRSLWGIENLAGIPGTVGAAPVQNIGAYGMELASSFVYADVLDATTGLVHRFSKGECAFGYRESRFKVERNLIILRTALALRRDGSPQTGYRDLAKRVEEGEMLTTPGEVGNVVRRIRAQKFPDLRTHGTAGSFFKNPIITEEAYGKLQARYPELPRYDAEGGVKVPLAYVLDKVLSLRGYHNGRAALYENQPLVIVAAPGATFEEVDALAQDVALRVHAATGIDIEREVRSIPHEKIVL